MPIGGLTARRFTHGRYNFPIAPPTAGWISGRDTYWPERIYWNFFLKI
jgi:hypothetical protein